MDNSPFPPIKITNQQFKSYHSVDRKLFCVLVHKLNRDASESMHVVAFLILLERECYSHNAVWKLLDWPLFLVNKLCDEIFSCLVCLEDVNLSNTSCGNLYLLSKLFSRNVSLRHFHENRIRVATGVSKIVANVCVRAFEDILQQKLDGYEFGNIRHFGKVNLYPGHDGILCHMGFEGNDTSPQRNMPNEFVNITYLSELFGGMKLINGCEDEPHVSEDDRTIFLTFSKGYYIAKSEIKDFFTRVFGDVIEEIYMQDVSPDELPLYARMVMRSRTVIPAIAPTDESDSKTKYSINGKHILAKKFVKKNRKNSSTSS